MAIFSTNHSSPRVPRCKLIPTFSHLKWMFGWFIRHTTFDFPMLQLMQEVETDEILSKNEALKYLELLKNNNVES
jgi:hypothetical protein